MDLILHPSYFIDVVSLVHLYHSNQIILEVNDNYVKQTYRNRCYIAAANGKLALNIPIIHQKSGGSVPYKSIEINRSEDWATQHLKSIKSAYNSSPFYEYYEADLQELFSDIPQFLMDWNLKTFHWILNLLKISKPIITSAEYLDDTKARQLVTAKQAPILLTRSYIQVFQEKHGFLNALSALDLIFNLGPSAGVFLKDQLDLLKE
ncbi:WbqC family protein [Nonlabens mediterrranea]|uniref:WbqC family protein n=1 Tax=Nonlabens mediterrranea TaxID=1419947 RepID=A0ABS0A6H8_9FLAO|nr:WbqC family protein [Nonlabens mediterrranea]